ncbi:MAG: AAA family ATPase [Myxococcota bacterium]
MLDEVPEDADHFLTSLYVHNAFAVRDLEIPIAKDGQRRHLLLTGPNGSGKSTILRGVFKSIVQGNPSDVDHLQAAEANAQIVGVQLDRHSLEPEQRASLEKDRAGYLSEIQKPDPKPLVKAVGVPWDYDSSRAILALVPANRALRLNQPEGPRLLVVESHYISRASNLLQFLVNLRTEQAYAREDGDDAAADAIGRRFDDFRTFLGQILEDDHARLDFDRASFEFRIILRDERRISFEQLPDGVSSILYIWAELNLRADNLRRNGVFDPPGWLLIDEPELHLHARLQETVLPFLINMFPNVQFIVATHSPAVLASISDATIFDLGSRQAIDSADLQGIRYGTILTEHFGIETDLEIRVRRARRSAKVDEEAERKLRAVLSRRAPFTMLMRSLVDPSLRDLFD